MFIFAGSIIFFWVSASGSNMGSAAGPEDSVQLGSTGCRKGRIAETSRLDLLCRGSPDPQRPRTSARHHRAEPGTHRATQGVIFLN